MANEAAGEGKLFDALAPREQAKRILWWSVRFTGIVALADFLQGEGLHWRTVLGGLIGLLVAGVYFLRTRAQTTEDGASDVNRTGDERLTSPGFASIGLAVGALWAHVPARWLLRAFNVGNADGRDWLMVNGFVMMAFAGLSLFIATLTLLSPKTTGSLRLAALLALAVVVIPIAEWVSRYRAM